jgi:hypothetical protein
MTWVRIDDSFPEHPKVLAAGDSAAWLYVAGICYSGRLLTDGFIPKEQVNRLTGISSPKKEVAALVAVQLWDEVPGGYQIHGYLEHQKSRDDVEKERDQARERQARKRSVSRSSHGVTQGGSHGVTQGGSHGTCNAEVREPDTDTDTDINNPLTPTIEIEALPVGNVPPSADGDPPRNASIVASPRMRGTSPRQLGTNPRSSTISKCVQCGTIHPSEMKHAECPDCSGLGMISTTSADDPVGTARRCSGCSGARVVVLERISA